MGRATELAQRRIKTGDAEPSYKLRIGGKRMGNRLYDGTASYSADGTSDLSLNADADLEALEGAKVELEVGYGDETWPWFGGWLEEPENDHWGGPAIADAYGPFRELQEISVGEDVSYASYTLGAAIAHLHGRAGKAITGSSYEIVGNPSYVLEGEEAALTLATTFGDGLETLLRLADWISTDRPGFVRRYRAKPRPRPAARTVATYTEAHYDPGMFKARRRRRVGAVGAYARDEGGNLKWPAVVIPVTSSLRSPVSPLRIYWLEEYAGSQADAYLECAELAALLSDGLYGWSLSEISANPELEILTSIRAKTTEERDEGGRFKERYAVEYACAIDTEASIDISREGHPMNVGGETAVKLSEKKLAKPFAVSRGVSAVVR